MRDDPAGFDRDVANSLRGGNVRAPHHQTGVIETHSFKKLL